MDSPESIRLRRRLWRFNIEVASYAHPLWLAEFRQQAPHRAVCQREIQSEYLIDRLSLGLVGLDTVRTQSGRLALLDAVDLRQLGRVAVAVACANHIRAGVQGRCARAHLRALGGDVVDRVLPNLGALPVKTLAESLQIDDQPVVSSVFVHLQKRFIRALILTLPPEAVARVTLRFRPGYFANVTERTGAHGLILALPALLPVASLSIEGRCILGS